MPARGVAALALLHDLPLLLLSAAALPVSWQCGLITVYRSTPQCGERSNATFRRQSAAVQTSHAPHGSKARLRVVTNRRDSWRSHVHRTQFRRLSSSSSLKLSMSGVEGNSPRLSLGDLKGVFSSEREYPLYCPFPHSAENSRPRRGLCFCLKRKNQNPNPPRPSPLVSAFIFPSIASSAWRSASFTAEMMRS